MMMSPASMRLPSSSTDLPVRLAGIITQATLGLSSLATNSSIVAAPVAPSVPSSETDPGLTSHTTHVWPSRMARRTILAPIRQADHSQLHGCSLLTGRAVAADECVGGAVVREFRISGGQLVGDLLGEYLAKLDAPLIEGVDGPDRSLYEHAVLIERNELAERRRSERLDQHGVRRTVAFEDSVRYQPRRRSFRGDLL